MRTNKITEAFVNGVPVIDGHQSNRGYAKIDALIELADPKRPLTGWSAGHLYQSLNAIEMHDENLFLSQWSVGGTIIGEELTDEAIRQYNESITNDSVRISSVLFRDGSVINIGVKSNDDVEKEANATT